ncbi:MAG: glycogen/starch/alpha-glucan phosphorylase [Eubacteriales bacterium]|nr:glycogen/starch/alpha-glucan phosphorylase [Eubacteriales bacterium]
MNELLTETELRRRIDNLLQNNFHTVFETATADDLYQSLSQVIYDLLQEKKWAFNHKRKVPEREKDNYKKIYYISMEFLMGQSLKNNLYNLELTEMVRDFLKPRGLTPEDLYACEPDAGLGNGGLGRLAACYMDAMASQGYDVTGFCIRYEYGLFRQKLVDGWQAELPDNWLPGGRVWIRQHPEDTFDVHFYGDYHEWWEEDGFHYRVDNPETVQAIPYDMLIPGAKSDCVAKLRLWKASGSTSFDMSSFVNGDFTKAEQQKNRAELISKVLYPADNVQEGKTLRLKQQYFMVSASCQNIVRDFIHVHGDLTRFPDKVAIHINDTHPALVIPELMRIFMDEYNMEWDGAWDLVHRSVSYTNHTVLQEALEKWNEPLLQTMLPRIYGIIKEIDRRFHIDMEKKFPGDEGKINWMAPIDGGEIRMANLSVIGSHQINGVSKLHSEILKEDLFHDFYLADPDKFTNVTNGIAYRRWLCQSNPELSELVSECIGADWKTNGSLLEQFAGFRNDPDVQQRCGKIKQRNKIRFSEKVRKESGISLDPDSLFIVQAKRLHEYKRQLLNAIRIITRMQMLRDDPNSIDRPETYLFAAKAAPSYYLAKSIIQLIAKIGQEIDRDPALQKKLKVVFLENYSVTMAESLMPAADISEQISLAGKEASGTGNMKLMINGAVTIGTLDGANVEMAEAVGPDNIFIFGQKAEEVQENLRKGYDAKAVCQKNPKLKRAVDALPAGFAGTRFDGLRDYLLKPSYSIADPYMNLLDFEDYDRTHERMQKAYEDSARWNHMAIVNIGKSARFSADRAVKEYADNIWHTLPIR